MTPGTLFKRLRRLLAIEQAPVSHAEKLVSALGGFIAILGVIQVSGLFVDPQDATLLVASMGASSVLLFAVPHGTLSQPWAVLGGHLVSALVGVSCAQVLGTTALAAAGAVGLAIGAMYYLRCIHPPGGATALVAVVGDDAVQALGYQFLITPVLLNVIVIVAVAVGFNYLFAWRRYPVWLQQAQQTDEIRPDERGEISHGDFVYALSELDSYIDISEYELLRIYELATHRSRSRHLRQQTVRLGGTYSNGEYGDAWSVRQVVDESPHADPERYMVIYKVVAGQGRRTSGCVSRAEFARWAKYRVQRDEENWKRLPTDDTDSEVI